MVVSAKAAPKRSSVCVWGGIGLTAVCWVASSDSPSIVSHRLVSIIIIIINNYTWCGGARGYLDFYFHSVTSSQVVTRTAWGDFFFHIRLGVGNKRSVGSCSRSCGEQVSWRRTHHSIKFFTVSLGYTYDMETLYDITSV